MIKNVSADATLTCSLCGVVVHGPGEDGHGVRWAALQDCRHCLRVLVEDDGRIPGFRLRADPLGFWITLRYLCGTPDEGLLTEEAARSRALLHWDVEDRQNTLYRVDYGTSRVYFVMEEALLVVADASEQGWVEMSKPKPLVCSRWVRGGLGHTVLNPVNAEHIHLLRDDGDLVDVQRSSWPEGFTLEPKYDPRRLWLGMLVGGTAGQVGPWLQAAAASRVLVAFHQPQSPAGGWMPPHSSVEVMLILDEKPRSAMARYYRELADQLGIPVVPVTAQDFESDLKRGMDRLGVDYWLFDTGQFECPVLRVSRYWEGGQQDREWASRECIEDS